MKLQYIHTYRQTWRHTHIHTYTHTHIHTYTHTHMYMYMYMYMYINTIHLHIHKHPHICAYIYIYLHTHTHIICMHVYALPLCVCHFPLYWDKAWSTMSCARSVAPRYLSCETRQVLSQWIGHGLEGKSTVSTGNHRFYMFFYHHI